jgi:hypothetical protein
MIEAEAPPVDETPDQKKQRKRSTILVSIPGWPHQEPGRLMVWGWRPSPQKAAREIKRLKTHVGPELQWSVEPLTATQARAIRLKPFNLRDYRARMGA